MAPFGAEYAAQLAATSEQLLTGVHSTVPTDRVLAAVFFTDIVGSTERAADSETTGGADSSTASAPWYAAS